jgi:antitoxin component of MazEF toxin-antitoxin module
MTITKKLTKHGNSYALIIERPILALLGIDDTTLLQISTPDGTAIMITPMISKSQKHRFASSLKKINKKYQHTLKRLAASSA